MYIILLSNDGVGRPDVKEVSKGTTVGDFVEDVLGKEMQKCVVQVNGAAVAADTELLDGQRVTVAPVNVKGGRV